MKRAVILYSLTGNTKEAAEFIAKEIGAELIQIETVKEMPKTMGKQIMLGGMQTTFGMHPKIKELPENITEFDEIILGAPIWAGKAAAPINTLLKNYNVADKVTAIFTFSGGGDNDKCIEVLSKIFTNMKCNVSLADRKSELARENTAKLEEFVKQILENV